MNFNPILDHPIRVFYSINVYQQSRLTHLFDLAPGDYSSSTFIKWLSTSDSVSVLSLVNFPAPLSSSQADTIPIVDDFLLKTLINLYSHTLSEVIDNPPATEAFTSLPDTRTSSKPTVILNSTNSIIQVNSETSSLLPISTHPSLKADASTTDYCNSLYLPPGFSAEYFGSIDASSFEFSSTSDLDSFSSVFTVTLSKLAELAAVDSLLRLKDHVSDEKKSFNYSLSILEDFLPKDTQSLIVPPKNSDPSFKNVFVVAGYIIRAESRYSSLFESTSFSECSTEYDALIKLLSVSGISYRQSEPPKFLTDDRSYIFVDEQEKTFASIRANGGYRFVSSDSEHFLADGTTHPPGQIITIYPALPEKPTAFSLLQIGLQESLLPFLLVIGICTLLAGATLIPAFIVQQLTSLYIPYGDNYALIFFGLSSIALLFITYLIQVIQARYLVRFEIISDANLQTMIIDRLLRIKPDAISAFSSGSLQSRVLGVSQLRETITSNLTPILTAYISVVFNLLYLFYFSWQLALIVILAGSILAISTLIAASLRVKQFKTLTELDGVMLASTNETITGIQELRSFDVTDDFFRNYTTTIRPLIKAIFNSTRLNDRVDVLSGSTTYILYLFLFPIAYSIATDGLSLSTGTIIAFLTCTQTFLSSFQSAIDKTVTSAVKVLTYWQRALEVLELPTEPSHPKTTPKVFDGSISVVNLTFSYPPSILTPDILNKPVITDINFNLTPSSSLLLVGPPGCGKSTILSLLSAMHENYTGSIFVSNTPLDKVSPRIYRAHISNAPQQLLFQQGSLKSNISSGLSVSDTTISNLLPIFGLDKFIDSLPMKLGTVVTPLAPSLPIAVKKKLFLLRAAIRSAKYVFLDDSLSGLSLEDCQSIISYFKSKGVTIVCTSSSTDLSSLFNQVLAINDTSL
jgi:ABC-type bacteriocin/lantibiotic exporter with double-glycine peptidase domain